MVTGCLLVMFPGSKRNKCSMPLSAVGAFILPIDILHASDPVCVCHRSMFTDSCRRLRIMRGSDAIGMGKNGYLSIYLLRIILTREMNLNRTQNLSLIDPYYSKHMMEAIVLRRLGHKSCCA